MRILFRRTSHFVVVVLTIVVSFLILIRFAGCDHKTKIDMLKDTDFRQTGLSPKLDYSGNTDVQITVHDSAAEALVAKAKIDADERLEEKKIEAEKDHISVMQSLLHVCLWHCDSTVNVNTNPPCDQACCDRKAHEQQRTARKNRGAAAPKSAPAPAVVIFNSNINNPAQPAPVQQQQVAEQPDAPATVAQLPPAPSTYIRSLNGVDTCLLSGPQYPGCTSSAGVPVEANFVLNLGGGEYAYTDNYRREYRDHYHRELPEYPRGRQPQPQPRPQPTPRPTPGPVGCTGCNPATGIGSGTGAGNPASGTGTGQGGRPEPVQPIGTPVSSPFTPARSANTSVRQQAVSARQSAGGGRGGAGGGFHGGGGRSR